MSRYPGVSLSVIRRLPRYHRFLGELIDKNVERISSREFAQLIGVTASQIRQDLNCFGGFGQQGYGYNVKNLFDEIGKILGLNRLKPTILIGAGNLGLALANHMNFDRRGFHLIGIFDSDPRKIGIQIKDLAVQGKDRMKGFCEQHHPEVAILTVPQEGVYDLALELVGLGIRGFWNFSQRDLFLDLPQDIAVENVHLEDSLMTLGFDLSQKDPQQPQP